MEVVGVGMAADAGAQQGSLPSLLSLLQLFHLSPFRIGIPLRFVPLCSHRVLHLAHNLTSNTPQFLGDWLHLQASERRIHSLRHLRCSCVGETGTRPWTTLLFFCRATSDMAALMWIEIWPNASLGQTCSWQTPLGAGVSFRCSWRVALFNWSLLNILLVSANCFPDGRTGDSGQVSGAKLLFYWFLELKSKPWRNVFVLTCILCIE